MIRLITVPPLHRTDSGRRKALASLKSGYKNTKRKRLGRRGFNLNVSLVIFAGILFYLISQVFTIMTSKKTDVYEVRTGSLADDLITRGIAVREEKIVESGYTGIINFYNKETERLGYGALAYTIDEKGLLQEYLSKYADLEKYYTESILTEFRQDAIDFTADFDRTNFQTIYDYKNSIQSASLKITNRSVLESIQDMSSADIHTCYSEVTGDIVYAVDGYENKTADTIRKEDFNESAYKKKEVANNQQVREGDPIFRVCDNETWSVVIRVDTPEQALALEKEGNIKIKFLKNGLESWASVSSRVDEAGDCFVTLTFTNSMVTFCTDRFIDVEVVTNKKTGLKVPNSSITTGEFFLIPKDFLTTGTEGRKGVYLQVYSSTDAEPTIEFVPTTPYSENEEYYFLDGSVLKAGEIILKKDSQDQFTLGDVAQLTGVYYINKGYADFREVSILYQNEDFAIVEPHSIYGLMEYDYIVLYANTINPEEFVNQ